MQMLFGWGIGETTLRQSRTGGVAQSMPIRACSDGGSFAGRVDAPLLVGNATVFLRGRYILDAIFAALVPSTAGATDVVLKGCSAGGQAAFIHANRLAALFEGVPRVAVVPGAGFFMDVVRRPRLGLGSPPAE